MRAFGAAVIVLGLIGWWLLVGVYGVFDTGKRLTKKETRPEAIQGIKAGAKVSGKVIGGVIGYYVFFFGAIFLLLVIIYGLGLG